MIDWLKSGGGQRPARVKSAPARDETTGARVVSDFESGTIFLRGPDGDVGLDWKKDDESRERALPPGAYHLRTVRVEHTSGKDHWFVSISGQHGPKYKLCQGDTTKIAVPTKVKFKAHARRRGGEVRLGFGITDVNRRGLSIYRNDRRVVVTYKMVSRDGRLLKSGKMNYG